MERSEIRGPFHNSRFRLGSTRARVEGGPRMVRYRRNFVPGGSYVFTVTLADRTPSALVAHASALRMAFRIARQERPFTIDAIVVLPQHLHAIWTLPPGDADFSGRWKRIKAHFT